MAVDLHRRSDAYNVFWIAWPQSLSILVMSIQSMVDLFWIGRLGTEAVAAVAICGNILNVIFALSGILQAGTVALVSRALGADEKEKASVVFYHSLLLGLITGALLLAAMYLLAPAIIGFFHTAPGVTRAAVVYLRIMSIHLMIVFMLIPMAATFSASGDTFTPLWIYSIGVAANAVLDPIFIFSREDAIHWLGMEFHPGVFGQGVFGAGMATNLAVLASFLLFLAAIRARRFPVRLPRWNKVKLEWFEFMRILRIGTPFAVAHMSRPLSTLVLLRLITGFGTGPVAGFGIAMRWFSVNFILFGGLGAAVSVLVGQHLGASSPEAAARVSRDLIRGGAILQVVMTGLLYWLARDLVALMDPNPAAVGPGADFMSWVVAGFLFSSPGGLGSAAMKGAGDTLPGMVAGLVSNWAVKLPLAWALAQIPVLGLDGIWLGMFISLVVEGMITLLWYGRGKWRTRTLARDGGTGV